MRQLSSWIWAAILILAACNTPTPTVSPLPQTSPIVVPGPFDSPVSATALPMGPAFMLNEPILEGATTITGTGGPNVPIRIVDISMSGTDIALGIVGSDGKFSLPVTGQLLKGHNIGIILGDLAGTSFKRDDFISGPNYSDLPYIGTIFASTHVQ